jgi:NDP-sugar pyrophosphorylase family protein
VSDLVGLIPAAGRGVRAYPYSATIPKSMLEVDGVPILRRNVELMRDQLAIREIYIVIGHRGEVIQSYFGDGGSFGLRITYVENPRVDLELPYSVFLAGRHIDRPCCMILADECYLGSNHADLREKRDPHALVTCAVINGESAKQIRKNYQVSLRDGQIVDLLEKPTRVVGPLMGTGTYLLQPELFRRLAEAYQEGTAETPHDWTSWLAVQARRGARIMPFYLTGKYVNVNSRDDLNFANYLVRDADFEQRRTSFVYIIDENEEAAASTVEQIAARGDIHEVVAVTRREVPALGPLGRDAKIRILTAPSPSTPMGHLVKLGLDSATGSILLLSYSDDTFTPQDISKFLVYLRDADLVVGTRTTRQLIEQGTNMRGIVRMAHIVLAKLAQILWWRFESRFTDIGCVYRGLWRSTYETVRDHLSEPGVEVFAEMVVEVLRARRRIIEIPINYYNRDLEHLQVWGKYQNVTIFARVVWLLVRRRLEDSALYVRLRPLLRRDSR